MEKERGWAIIFVDVKGVGSRNSMILGRGGWVMNNYPSILLTADM